MNKAIVYSKFMGVIQVVAFMGNQWWNMTRDDIFSPIRLTGDNDDDIDFRYLCEPGDTLMVKDLVGLMGSAAENPEGKIMAVMNDRLETLIKMGVKFLNVPQTLKLRFGLFDNSKELEGEKGFTLECEDMDNSWQTYFSIDDFETAEEAVDFMLKFGFFFRQNGVNIESKLFCTKELMVQLEKQLNDINLEEDEFNG